MRALKLPSSAAFFGFAVAVALWSAPVSTQAQTFDPRYPVCMHVYSGASGGGGEWYDCSFAALPQCRAMASGRAATCDLNPYYLPRPPAPSRYRRGG